MNRIISLIAALLLTGCSSTHTARQRAAVPEYDSAAASALAFDSPVMPPYVLAGLARGPREPAAFAGFQDTVTEFFAVSIDDHQSNDPYNDTYDRESVSVKTGVRYR